MVHMEKNNGFLGLDVGPQLKKAIDKKAREKGISMAEYIRRLVIKDLIEV